jgi:hypothetical protein
MQVVHGDCHFIQSMFIDDFRRAWFERNGKSVLFTSDCPDAQIVELIINSRSPVFVFIEDPIDVNGYVIASRGFSVLDALRRTDGRITHGWRLRIRAHCSSGNSSLIVRTQPQMK